MKLKALVYAMSFLVYSNVTAMFSIPSTPQEREGRYIILGETISNLGKQLRAGVRVPREQKPLERTARYGGMSFNLSEIENDETPYVDFSLSDIEVDESPKAEMSDADSLRQQIIEFEQERDAIKKTAASRDDRWVQKYLRSSPSSSTTAFSSTRGRQAPRGGGLPPLGSGVTETAADREWVYNDIMRTGSENDKEIQIPELRARAHEAGDEWVKRLAPSSPISNPRPPSDQQSDDTDDVPSPWFTPQRSLIAAGVLGLGYMFQKAPEWAKQRVKRILKTHGKKLSDLDPAEQDLMMAVSYHRFNPVGSFFFQEAVLDMPDGTDLRDELWPVLNHVYYGKRKVSRKQARELRKLYDEAKELMVVN